MNASIKKLNYDTASFFIIFTVLWKGKEKRTLAVRILFSVPGPGIEPGWIAPTVFETVASTDSAIRAFHCAKLRRFFRFRKYFSE